MRRRKSPRVVWLPPDVITTDVPNNLFASGTAFGSSSISVSGAQPIDVLEVPLTIDQPRDFAATESLADIEDSSYRLRRIVGKIWVWGDRLDDESGINEIILELGIIVRKVTQEGTSLALALDQTTPGAFDNTHPAAAQNAGDPWVWQHLQVLRSPVFTPVAAAAPVADITPLLVDYEVKVDQKTARIVGPEERVFLVMAGIGLNGPQQSEITNDTKIHYQLRVLASMRSGAGNRRNASR